jgi:hypothetical protein
MKDLIEKLKDNKVCFGLLSEQEQECFKKVGKSNCQLMGIQNLWEPALSGEWSFGLTYRIKPDYQPEPKEKKLLVKNHSNNWLMADGECLTGFLNRPDFIAFEYEDGSKSIFPRKNAFYLWTRPPADIPKYVILREK